MNAAADIELTVTEIQRFCMHDGPGVRTTVFLKGCPLRCAWCHNPETQSPERQLLFYGKKCIGCGACSICQSGAQVFGESRYIDRDKCTVCGRCADVCPASALQISGSRMSVSRIADEAEKDRAFYGEDGGVTVSGGEPFFQPRGLIALLRECRKRGLGTAVDTCGYFDPSYLPDAVPLTDLFLFDIKDTDPDRHKKYTGADPGLIIKNLYAADRLGARIRLRCILVNGVNTDEAHYAGVARIAASLHNCDGVDVLPYHAYAGTKATFLGLPDNGRKEWIPDEDTVRRARLVMNGKL